MKRTLARYTEWAWAEGRLSNSAEVDPLSLEFWQWLESRFEGRAGRRALALEEIQRDMRRTFRVLSYGGRNLTQIASGRRDSLREEATLSDWISR